MSIFGTILNKIFHHAPAPASAPAQTSATAAGHSTAPAATPAPAPSPAPTPQQPVDVEAVLAKMAASKGNAGNWRESIVDLLKLLSIDSSLANRKALAGELGYTGDTNDSATMNVWLHKAVMRKLAENGGIVPDELR